MKRRHVALAIGKHNSTIQGKNYMLLQGRPLCEYPMMAAHYCQNIDHLYVSTDSPVIKDVGLKYNAHIIDRPESLARSESPTEFVFQHAYEIIQSEIPDIGYLLLMFCNSVDILPSYIDEAINLLDQKPDLDSVVSVSKYNMFTPLRAHHVKDGELKTVLDLPSLGIPNTFHRDAMGDIYFVDFGVQIVRPERCLKNIEEGALPFRWLGHKIGTLKKEYGFDIDYEWQIPVMDLWLKQHGFSKTQTPYQAGAKG